MKREGRQHGMVRSYRIMPSPLNPNLQPRFINSFESPPTAGMFTKVTTKPTNHSKFTGKCARPKCSDCHIHPAGKSKDKAKGNQKVRSACDVSSNCGLLSWRVADPKPTRLKNFSGSSASGILDDLMDEEEEEVEESDELAAAIAVDVKSDEEIRFGDVGILLENINEEEEDWVLVGQDYVIV